MNKNRTPKAIFLVAFCTLAITLLALMANAELVAVSQLGYHPDGNKNVIAYTNATAGTFSIIQKSTNISFATYPLQKARDFNGNIVECQGNNPCLSGDFSDFKIEGAYFIQTSLNGRSPEFAISANIYKNTSPVFLEFFNAMQQQKSAYHADLHASHNPIFPAMADGSFLLQADQASITLIRLASAYRRNPSLFSSDKYPMLAANKPDIIEYIVSYARYLRELQGLKVQSRTDGQGFRTGWTLAVHNAFVPGPTNLTNLTIYNSASLPFATVPVKSLCGNDDGSAAWDKCIADAATYYRCQADEPCINASYIDKTGLIISRNNGYGVSNGWGPDFSCRIDVDLINGVFNNAYNPCIIFDGSSNRKDTTEALFAFLLALPAINDYDEIEAREFFNRSVNTYRFIKSAYAAFNTSAEDTSFWGASLFLLYDYTGNQSYLREAHSVRNIVSQVFVSDHTHGNEYYWHEYVKHRDEIAALGLEYPVSASDPGEFFRGKMFFDYKDSGPDKAISRTAERVFQFDPNIQFMNSRYMLTEAVLAAKTAEIYPAEPFIPLIADAQLSWMTGMNGVQQGTQLNSRIISKSFIFGIGDFPEHFHSSLLGKNHRNSSNGRVAGVHTPIYQFRNGSGAFIFLDGSYDMMGNIFGSSGNGYRNEKQATIFVHGQTFNNGLNYIPGWINGAFDVFADTDIIFNYADNLNVYQFTESSNELVGIAVELYAYLDGRYNNRQPHALIKFSSENSSIPTNPLPNNSTNSTPSANNSCHSNVQAIPATCTGAIILDSYNGCRNIICRNGPSNLTILACDKPTSSNPANFEMYKQGEFGPLQLEVCIGLACIKYNGFEKSTSYPICINATPNAPNSTPQNDIPPNPPANETPVPTNSTPANPNASCFSRVNDLPASCTSSITQDTKSGCRSILCGDSANSISIMACDKPDSGAKQFFEMYRQTAAGTTPKICIGNTCMQNEGYVKSQNYPICAGGNSTTPTNTTPIPTNSTPTPEDTDPTSSTPTNTTSSVALSIAPWYPQGSSYVFRCTTSGYIPTAYNWIFGDGQKQLNSINKDVYHTYSLPGKYTVQCNARNSETSLWDSLNVTVV